MSKTYRTTADFPALVAARETLNRLAKRRAELTDALERPGGRQSTLDADAHLVLKGESLKAIDAPPAVDEMQRELAAVNHAIKLHEPVIAKEFSIARTEIIRERKPAFIAHSKKIAAALENLASLLATEQTLIADASRACEGHEAFTFTYCPGGYDVHQFIDSLNTQAKATV